VRKRMAPIQAAYHGIGGSLGPEMDAGA